MLTLLRPSLFLLFASMAVALIVLVLLRIDENRGPLDAEEAALQWVGDNAVAQEPRRDGDAWEIDIVRPDGSMVQVRLGERLELRGFDEEIGPAGTLASDELRGAERARAVRAAFVETGPGHVVSVERDSPSEVEVRVRTAPGRQIEVELDEKFRIVHVDDEEDPRDE
jgi:hypothetical protein